MKTNPVYAQYCICVIRAVMQGLTIPAVPEDLSLKVLFDFAKMHSVEALVYHGLSQLNMQKDDPVWQHWENRADMLVTQSVVQLAERDVLFVLLPSAGINILPVKGCWLKELYPEIDYRQMSDLDILIQPDHEEKARKIMVQQGYFPEEDAAANHDGYKKTPYMGVELHHSLLPREDPGYPYYEDVWQRAQPVADHPGVFRLSPEDEYIYYMLHLRKHVLYAGTGIRSFLDSVVYRSVKTGMDQNYLHREYETLGITEFVRQVETLSDCWFVKGWDTPDDLKAMEASVFAAGTYGTETKLFQNELHRFQTSFKNPLAVKSLYLLHCLFLPLKDMQELYPVLRKAPVLLPLLWVWRFASRCVAKPKGLLDLVRRTNEEGDRIWSEFNWQKFRSK